MKVPPDQTDSELKPGTKPRAEGSARVGFMRATQVLAGMLLLSATTLFAQVSDESRPANESPPAILFADDPDEEQEREPTAEDGLERTVYVPFENLEDVFEERSRGVFLPFDEYEKLWQAFQRARQENERAPEDGQVLLAECSGELVEGGLQVEVRLEVESLREGWSRVRLGSGLPTIMQADMGEARLSRSGNVLDLLLPERGKHEVRLTFLLPVEIEGERSKVNLRLPQAAIGRFEMTLPEADLEVDPGAGVPFTTRPVDEGQATAISFLFNGGQTVPFSWRVPDQEASMEPLYFVEGRQQTEIQPGVVTDRVELDVRVLRGGLERMEIELGDRRMLLDANIEPAAGGADAGLVDWRVESADEAPVLVVRSAKPMEGRWRVTLVLESALKNEAGELALNLPMVRGAVRQRGEVVVLHEPELEVTATAGDGVSRRADGDVPEGLESAGRFRFLEMPFGLAATVSEAEPSIELASELDVRVRPERVELSGRWSYEVRRAAVFQMELGLPEGWREVEVEGPGVVDSEVKGEGDERRLEVRFGEPKLGTGEFTVTAWQARAEPAEALSLPVLPGRGVRTDEGRMRVWVDGSLSPTTAETGDLRPADREVDQQRQSAEAGGSLLFFSYRDPQRGGVLKFSERPSQVTGDVITRIEVEEQRVVYQWAIVLQVRHAGIESFVLAVPEDLADRFQLVDRRIREVRVLENADEEAGDDDGLAGTRRLEVVLRERKLGQLKFEARLEEPLPGLGEGGSERLSVPFVRLPGLFQETGQVALGKSGNIEILAADAEGLEETDPRLLRSGGSEGVFIAWQYRQPPVALELEVARNVFVAVPGAVIPHADLSVAVSTDGAMACEMVLWLRNRTQQFLTLRLPDGARLVSDVYVGGVRQQPMQRPEDDALLVRLDGASAEQQVPVRLIYELASEDPGSLMPGAGRWQVPVPEVEDVRILQSRLRLYLPHEAVFTRFKGVMRLPVEQAGWARFRRLADVFVPALGPGLGWDRPTQWTGPPALDEQAASGMDLELPREGQRFDLHRLAEPGEVTVHFRSRGRHLVFEGILFLLVLAGAMLVPRRLRLIYAIVVGVGLLLLAGWIQGRNGSIALAGALGVILAVPVWLGLGVLRLLAGRWRNRGRASADGPPDESGDRQSGDRQSGDRQSGDRQSGNRPAGPHSDEQTPSSETNSKS